MVSALHRAGRQAAHEVFAGDDVDEQRRQAPRSCAAAMSTLYSLTPVEVLTRLFSATVIGWLSTAGEHHAEQEVVPDLGELPDHATTTIGGDSGSMMRQKMVKKPGAVDAWRP